MIKLENVSKSYKEIRLLDSINLTIEDCSKVAIQGINGSGKSVLLKMICGYAKPDSGTITIDGKALDDHHSFIPNAGISINAPEFISSMSGLDNLLYLADIRKVATKEDILALAKELNLDGLKKKYRTYSLGMKQKLRLIQALMEKPKYLILDEPFDGLDAESVQIAKNLIRRYSEESTLIFISHNVEDMEDLADNIYKIENRKLVQIK